MNKREVLNTEIWICTNAEANDLWQSDRANRHKIWTEAEDKKYFLADTEILQGILDKKRKKPGSYL